MIQTKNGSTQRKPGTRKTTTSAYVGTSKSYRKATKSSFVLSGITPMTIGTNSRLLQKARLRPPRRTTEMSSLNDHIDWSNASHAPELSWHRRRRRSKMLTISSDHCRRPKTTLDTQSKRAKTNRTWFKHQHCSAASKKET